MTIPVSPRQHSSKRQVINMNCNNCGFQMSDTAAFCPNCGASVPEAPTEFLFDKSCPHCHAPLLPGAVFCNTCGKNVDGAVVDERICIHCGCPLKPEAEFCPNCGNSVTAGFTPSPAPRPVPTPKPKKDNSALVLIIILIVIIAISIGVVAWLLLKPEKTPAPITPKPTPTASSPITTPTPEPSHEPLPTTVPVSSDYLFPSDSVYITYSDLYGRSQDEIAFIRNEIYARHGYIFQTEPYKSYFSAKSWYSPNPYFDESYFSYIEKANKDFIVEYEKSMGWR